MATNPVPPEEQARRKRICEECLQDGWAPPKHGGGKGSMLAEAERRGAGDAASLWKAIQKGQLVIDWTKYKAPPAKGAASPTVAPPPADPAGIDRALAALRKTPLTLEEIAAQAGISKGQALDAIEGAIAAGANIHLIDGHYSVERTPRPRETGELARFSMTSTKDNRFEFGFVTDNHLGSKYERLDVLNDLYDRFAEAGITVVLNGGNWIDGEHRFNRHELLVHGMDAQCAYLAKHYPKRDGITTYFVAGDDHEGWYAQREGVDIGRYAENKFREIGRTDARYLGYIEADIPFVNANSGERVLVRLVHPGGGSAYALSYAMQKYVEALEGGDKPAAVLNGHYHKQEIFNYRNVWIIQGGCTKDQDSFMRKKKIEAHVGGVKVSFLQDPSTGALIECNGMFRYFNRDYAGDYGRGERWNLAGDVKMMKRTLGGV